jgi:aryl-alcohol dehydrogenase-like predicted oxidoreductase
MPGDDHVRRDRQSGYDDCVRMIDVAVENGINFIDTADMYGDGESEQIVGQGPFARLSGPSRGGPAVLSSRVRRRAREPSTSGW